MTHQDAPDLAQLWVSAATTDHPAPPAPVLAAPDPVRAVLVPAHGGCGASLLAALTGLPEACPADLAGRAPIVVARTHLAGLTAAQQLLAELAGPTPARRAMALVVVADAPGRLPRPLRDVVRVLTGAAGQVIEVPWVEAWRYDATQIPAAAAAAVARITSLAQQEEGTSR